MKEQKLKGIEKFRHELNRIFDDNLRTKQWQNYVDYAIIGLIIISTLEVFLSTYDGVVERYGKWLHFVDVFTTIFFTIEVSLRIWCADLLDPKYKGFWGRVRYCFSFYGLIDMLSTYTFYLALIFPLPYVALKALRIARLLRVFRYMKSFRLLTDAFASKKKELGISLQFLVIITLILAFILYFVENAAQPDVFNNGWKSVLWAFSQYIGDPGGFADYQPVTVMGRIISTIIGVLGIAIFAVPAGLIGSGFLEAVEKDNKKQEIEENIEKVGLAFERKLDRYTGFQVAPMNLSIPEIIARMRMNESEIVEAVAHSDNFRIINLASTVPVDNRPSDKLAIEHFVLNRPYGCCIDRGSKITIVSPSSLVDPVMGYFSYYLAKIGGFNLISRELGKIRPYKSFYSSSDFDSLPGFAEYKKDIESLTTKEGSWLITLLAASGQNEPELPTQIHLGYGNAKGEASLHTPTSLLKDKELAEKLFASIESTLEKEFDIKTDRHLYHACSQPNLYYRHLDTFDKFNGLVIRTAWSCICWDSRRIFIAKTIADVLNREICGQTESPADPELKIRNIGFADYKN